MTLFRYLLIALALAAIAALLAWAIGPDPGVVLIERGEWRLKTTLAFAIVLPASIGAVLALLWLATRWPLAAWRLRRRQRSSDHLLRAIVAARGRRWRDAADHLDQARRDPAFADAALIAALAAAEAEGDPQLIASWRAEIARDARLAALVTDPTDPAAVPLPVAERIEPAATLG